MRLPTLLLYKKEFQQNSILYLLPAPFAFALIYLKLLGVSFPNWMGPIMGLAIPFTLAVAYGLQGFDVEEDAQTRDFLLVKPLSLKRIVGEKYVLGLGVLLCWTIIFLWGAAHNLVWPSIFTIDSWVPSLVFAGSIIVFSASFFTGLWISGPKKLLAATAVSLIGLSWGFFILSSVATFIIHSQTLAQLPFLQELFLYLTIFVTVTIFVLLQLSLSIWFLLQRPQLSEYPKLGQLTGIAIFIPIFAVVLNFSTQPPIRSSYFYGSELLGLETPFWVADGVWQPNGSNIAVIGNQNRIALTRLGQKPHVILWSHKKDKRDTLIDLSWSPDGHKLAFVLKNQVYFMDIRAKKPVWIGKGFSPCWSEKSDAILFSRENVRPERKVTNTGTITVHTIDFYKADLRNSRVEPKLRVQSLDTYWTWDSSQDIVLFTNPYGGINVYHQKTVESIGLPGFPMGREIAFWSRYYRSSKQPNKMLAGVFSMNSNQKDHQQCNIRFYQINLQKKNAQLISQRLSVRLNTIILEPDSGTALWGNGSTYKKESIYNRKEVKP